jgi:hypothetical protein
MKTITDNNNMRTIFYEAITNKITNNNIIA